MASSKVYKDSFPGEISADVARHPRSAERKMLSEFKEIEEETSARGERMIFNDKDEDTNTHRLQT